MAQGIVNSMFGIPVDPRQQAMQNPMSPQQFRMGLIGGATAGMQQGVNRMFGMQNPQEKLMSVIQQAQQQYDLSTPEGLNGLADMLNQHPELAGIAMSMRQEAGNLRQRKAQFGLQEQIGQSTVARNEAMARKYEADILREPAQPAPKVLGAGERLVSATGEVIAEGGAKPEAISPQMRQYKEMRDMGMSHQEALRLAYKTENPALDFRREMQQQKEEDKRAAKEQVAQSTVTKIDNTMNTVEKALGQVGSFTAGLLGSPLSLVPGTPAKDLERNLTTIKANLGFDQLQSMRDASPTGGALGQVSNKEIDLLNSAVAALDNSQSPQQLRENLQKIRTHYTNWRNTIKKAEQQGNAPATAQPAARQAPATSQGGFEIIQVR